MESNNSNSKMDVKDVQFFAIFRFFAWKKLALESLEDRFRCGRHNVDCPWIGTCQMENDLSQEQCDQMEKLFYQYLAIYYCENMPNRQQQKAPKVSKKLANY